MPWFDRARDILLHPKRTWPVIDGESADVASICRSYLIVLAAIPAVAGFIGLSLIGYGGNGIRVQVPVTAGLVQLAASVAATLLGVFLVSLAVDAMAPKFGGTASRIGAYKLVAYGSTACLLSGVFALVQGLGALELLASAYSVYLVYTGLPVLMKCPAEKAGVFTAAVVACAIVTTLVLTVVLTGLVAVDH